MFDIWCFFPSYKLPLMKSWVPTDFPGETVGMSCLCYFCVYSTKCIIYMYIRLSNYLSISIYLSINLCVYIYMYIQNIFKKYKRNLLGCLNMIPISSNFQWYRPFWIMRLDPCVLLKSPDRSPPRSSSPHHLKRRDVAMSPQLVSSNFRWNSGVTHIKGVP